MPGFDFPIRTKLAIWAALGVALVAGMLAEQQIGDRFGIAAACARRRQAAHRRRGAAAPPKTSAPCGSKCARCGLPSRQAMSTVRLIGCAPPPPRPASISATAVSLSDDAGRQGRAADTRQNWRTTMSVSAPILPRRRRITAIRSQRSNTRRDRQGDECTDREDDGATDRRRRMRQCAGRRIERACSAGSISASACSSLSSSAASQLSAPLASARPIRRIGEVLLRTRPRQQGRRGALYRAHRRGRRQRPRGADVQGESCSASSSWRSPRRKPRGTWPSSAAPMSTKSPMPSKSTVASVVRSVSSSSTELEAAAEALGAMAGATRDLSGESAVGVDAGRRECPFGFARHRAIDRVGRRDQPASPGIDADRARGGGAGREDRRPHRRADPCRRTHRRRGQAHHRDRRADQPAGAQCHHRGGARRRGRQGLRRGRPGGQGAGGADREGDQRDRPADRGRAGGDRRIWSAASRRSAAPSAASPRSPPRSPPPSNLQAATTREIAENVQAATGSAAHVATNLAEVNDSAGGITSASAQILSSAKSLSQDGSRLTVEMEKLLSAVIAA